MRYKTRWCSNQLFYNNFVFLDPNSISQLIWSPATRLVIVVLQHKGGHRAFSCTIRSLRKQRRDGLTNRSKRKSNPVDDSNVLLSVIS